MELGSFEDEHKLLPQIDLSAEIIRLQEDLINERERNLRTHADFQNYRRRIERDGNRIADESKKEIFLAFLEILDDMEKALVSAKEVKKTYVKGMQMILKKFLTLLEKQGVVSFECIGKPFDHNLHEAVAMATHEGSEPRTVVDELRRGYLLNNELLRPAQVRVSG